MPSTLTGLDFGTTSVKAVEMNGRTVVRHAELPIDRNFALVNEEGFLYLEGLPRLVEALRAQGFNLRRVAVGLDGKSTILRYTRIPPVPDKRLKILMDFETGEYANQSGTSFITDYDNLRLPPSVCRDFVVLVAVAKEQYIANYMKGLKNFGVRPVEFVPMAVSGYKPALTFAERKLDEVVLVVDIGASFTNVAIVMNDNLLFARSLLVGGDVFTEEVQDALGVTQPEAEAIKKNNAILVPGGKQSERAKEISLALSEAANALHGQLNSTLNICRGQTGQKTLKVDKILLTGGGARLDGLGRYLSARFRCTIEKFSPVGEGLETLTCAMGLAMGLDDPSGTLAINLLPPKERAKKHFMARDLFVYLGAALVVVGLIVHMLLMSGVKGRLEPVAAAIQSEESELAARAQQLVRLKKEISAAKAETAVLSLQRVNWSAVLETYTRMNRLSSEFKAANLVATRVSLVPGQKGGQHLVVGGTVSASAQGKVEEYFEKLKNQNPYIDPADSQITVSTPSGDKYDFEMRFAIKGI